MTFTALVMALAYVVFVGPYNVMKQLVKNGAELSRKWKAAKARRMELKHKKEVLNMKPGDKEHLGYVCD